MCQANEVEIDWAKRHKEAQQNGEVFEGGRYDDQ